MNIDSIITEWTYRLEKGYPDCPEDYIELRNVLREQTDLSKPEQDAIVRRAMGLEEDMVPEPNSVNDTDFATLISDLTKKDEKGKNISSRSEIELFAKYTQKHYNTILPSGVSTIFRIENYKNNVNDEGYYVIGDEISNKIIPTKATLSGIQKESIIFTYMNGTFAAADITHIESQMAGVDGAQGNLKFEVKTTQGSKQPNLNLQTTFYSPDPNKFYIVAFGDDVLDVYIISSVLLRRLALGEQIHDELTKQNVDTTLRKQIQDGLSTFNFEEHIIAALVTGDTGQYKKSFKFGNNLSIDFKIFIRSNKFSAGQASDGENDNLTAEGYEI